MMRSRRFSRRLVICALVSLWAFIPAWQSPGAPALGAQAHAASVVPDVRGVYFLQKADTPFEDGEISSPHVAGLSVRSGWQKIEPEEGAYNWEYLDGAVKTAGRNGKKVMLRVLAGIATPQWVYKAGVRKFEYTDQNPYHPTYGQSLVIPVPWDDAYLDRWAAFVKALGARYNGEESVSIVQMTGPARGGEMHLDAKKDREGWRAAGYTNARLVEAWKRTIDAYAAAFPDKCLAIDIAKPVAFDNGLEVVRDVLAYGYARLGARFCVQGNWLSAKTGDDFDLYGLVKEYSSMTTVGFQMLWFTGGAGENGSGQGNEDGQPSDDADRPGKRGRGERRRDHGGKRGDRMGGTLREAVDKGLAAGADYLEIYGRDIMNPALRDDIRYASERLKAVEGNGHAD
jgi:hypothetical protein